MVRKNQPRGNASSTQAELKSSWLKSAEYNPVTEELTLITKRGARILVPEVEERLHWLFTHSPPGKFFNHHLKSKVKAQADEEWFVELEGRRIKVDAMTYQKVISEIMSDCDEYSYAIPTK